MSKSGIRRARRTTAELTEIRRKAVQKRWGASANAEFGGGFQTVSLPRWIVELLRDEAGRRGCSVSALVREAVATLFR